MKYLLIALFAATSLASFAETVSTDDANVVVGTLAGEDQNGFFIRLDGAASDERQVAQMVTALDVYPPVLMRIFRR
jgi:hypothetical protein